MKTFLSLFIAAITALWAWQAWDALAASGHAAPLPWLVYQQGLLLSGIWAIALMSLAMLLSARPAWLERPLGGLDHLYGLHKWSGILAIGAAGLHWLFTEVIEDFAESATSPADRQRLPAPLALLVPLRGLAKDAAELLIYALLAMLVITLCKRVPYRSWKFFHRFMPLLYLGLLFHAAALMPAGYWRQPLGVALAGLLALAVAAAGTALAGRAGWRRRSEGNVTAVRSSGTGVLEVCCAPGPGWTGHQPGQFVLLTFDRHEGAHPFTIASAPRSDGRICCQIKAAGDCTSMLAVKLHPGSPVMLEGPYGCFWLRRADPAAQQVWIAAGIGVTPFLAWLEALPSRPDSRTAGGGVALMPVALHYFTHTLASDPFASRLHALCATRAVLLHLHETGGQHPRDAAQMLGGLPPAGMVEIWFCGPAGLAARLKNGFRTLLKGRRWRFHQEAFEWR